METTSSSLGDAEQADHKDRETTRADEDSAAGIAAEPTDLSTAGASTREATVDILELLHAPQSGGLEVVRLGDSETALVPFTRDGKKVKLHYCEEPEIRGYTHCVGKDCVLCRIGRKAEERTMLPVYLPAARAVGVLAVSPSLRPYALLPQLAPALKAAQPVVVFVRREGSRYHITTRQLKPNDDAGADVIKAFLEKYKAGMIDLGAVYPRLNNEQLTAVSEIGRLLSLKEGTRAGG